MRFSAILAGASLSLTACTATHAAVLKLDPYVGASLGDGHGETRVLGLDVKPAGIVGSIKAGLDLDLGDRFAFGPTFDYFPGQSLFGNKSFGCGTDCTVTGGITGTSHMAVDPAEPTDPNVVILPRVPTVVPIGGTTQVHVKAGSIAYGFRGGVKLGANRSWFLYGAGGWDHATGVVKISGHSPFGTWQNKIKTGGNGHYVGIGLEKRLSPHWSLGAQATHTTILFKEYGVTEKVNFGSVDFAYHF